MTEGAGTDPGKMNQNVRRQVVLHAAHVKRQKMKGDTPKNVIGLQAPASPRPAPLAKVIKAKGVPARGPKASDAGLMNSSSSGSAMGPAYMR